MDVYQSIVFPKILKVSSFITAQYTIFGWLPYGQADSGANVTAYLTLHSVSEDTSNQLLRAFWEVEEVHTPKDSYTNEEQLALVHYEKTTIKTRDGLYQEKLPRRPDAPVLGDSRKQAERRLASTELSLKRKEKWDCFREVINDYFTNGHAELVPNEDLKKPASSVFYLPMHGVTKQSSTSTKLRAVFDASAATSTGVSLNDILLPGPNVYSPLPDILLRFRLHKIGLTADISKMFRMIELHPIDRDLHRYLWTTDSSHMVDCRMTRLTFGITSSPFIAAQTLQRIASDNAELYPQAAKVVQKNFYVDDCLTGAESVTEATELRAQLNGLLGQGNMQLRKWRLSSRVSLTVSRKIYVNKKWYRNFRLPMSFTKHWESIGIRVETHFTFLLHLSNRPRNSPSGISPRISLGRLTSWVGLLPQFCYSNCYCSNFGNYN